MNKFLIKVGLFSIIPLPYFLILFCVNLYLLNEQEPKLKHSRILILGDSHPQTSVDDEVLKSANNISKTAETYMQSYWKLRVICKKMKPDTVILGFGPHNLSAFNDLKFSEEPWVRGTFKNCYSFFRVNELRSRLKVDYIEYLRVQWKQMCVYPNFNHIHYIGNFAKHYETHLDKWEHLIERHYYDKEMSVLGISDVSIAYLDSISNFCNNNNIVLALVSSPLHSSYRSKIPSKFIETFEKVKVQYTNKAILVDRSFATYPDSMFLDPDHLNYYGAQRFTSEVRNELNRNKEHYH